MFNGMYGAIPVSEIAAYVNNTKTQLDFDFMVKVCRALDQLLLERSTKSNEANEG